jgi:hypothetical protein
MSNISPKLIDVENNRVEFNDWTFGKSNNDYGEKKGGHWQAVKQIRSVPPETGRFPTQLFCNIKNDKFKYVKTINI